MPRGLAWLGLYDVGVTGAVTKYDCPGQIPSRSFVVPRFFLDPDEATNACYAHCVTEGECVPPLQDPAAPDWQSPDFTEFPVAVDRARAEAFCSWRRGRLASVAELVRADQGDAYGGAPEWLIDQLKPCVEAHAEDCGMLDEDRGKRPARAVRKNPDDRGPFGHWDVATSQVEVTMTRPGLADPYCELPPDAVDPKTFSPAPPYFAPYFAEFTPLWMCTNNEVDTPPGKGHWVTGSVLFDDGGTLPPMKRGVRCAYDPAP